MPKSLKHDLRTPLNHIIGYCEMLLEEESDLPQKEFVADLERIHVAGRRLLIVVNDLFDPVKSITFKFSPEQFDHEFRTPLNQIIGYAEMLQEEGRECGAGEFVEDVGKILTASRELLRLILENFSAPEFPSAPADSRNQPGITSAPVEQKPRTAAVSQTGSILVVDDDEANRSMLARRLVRLGHKVAVAEDGRRALAALGAGKFDLMLLDIQMPELNGYEVLEQMKDNPALRSFPVIVLSASDETASVVRCIEMGAEDYLPKPFDAVLLRARIDASLEKKRLRDREVSYLHQIQEEKKRSDDLLHIILPRDVAAELKSTRAVKPRRFENVGVLFCDIVSFTAYCDEHSPELVHTHLQSLVEAFEAIIVEHGLEKIKTVGDSFMATAGLPVEVELPALSCVRCGLAMIEAARTLPPHWQIRVGVHAGPLVAGVVGRQKYQFDIWGDTVNTAARMMQAAAPGTIYVTAATWESLSKHCEGVPRGLVPIKGKGEIMLHSISGILAG